MVRALKPALRERLHGIGVAAPLSLGGWNVLLGIAPGLAAKAGDDTPSKYCGRALQPPWANSTAAASTWRRC